MIVPPIHRQRKVKALICWYCGNQITRAEFPLIGT